MKTILSLLLLAAAPLAASAQTSRDVRPATPPGLTLAEPDWAPVYAVFFGTGGGGASGPAVHPRPLPGNELSYPAPGWGGGVTKGDGIWRRATVRMTNSGPLAVKLVRMDFVFRDPATGAELMRIRHASKMRLRPGKTFLHQKTVKRSQRTRRGDGARVSVELKEVVYADGSVWTP
ncbi:MAG TPA: hypothetical protein VF508_04515 [Pyrinomonadaceae bacterium]